MGEGDGCGGDEGEEGGEDGKRAGDGEGEVVCAGPGEAGVVSVRLMGVEGRAYIDRAMEMRPSCVDLAMAVNCRARYPDSRRQPIGESCSVGNPLLLYTRIRI